MSEYRKLPLISPGLIQLRKGFFDGLINGGVYNGNTKNRFETSYSSVDRNMIS